MLTEVPSSDWLALFEAARNFYHLAPWQWMADTDLFGIVNPDNQEKCVATVMGQQGGFFAIGFYRGKQGFLSYQLLQSEEDLHDPDRPMYEQDCLMVSFDDLDNCDPEDKALLDSIGFDLQGMDRIPGVRSYRKGMMPWAPNLEEVRFLGLALRQAAEVAQTFQEDPNHFTAPAGEKGKLRFFTFEGGNWVANWDQPDGLFNLSPDRFAIPDSLEARLQQLPQGKDMLLFEQFFLESPTMDPRVDRPFFGQVLVLLNLEKAQFAGADSTLPGEFLEQGAERIVEMWEAAGTKPGTLVVSTKENYLLLQPLARKAGIEIHLDPEVQVLQGIKEALKESTTGE